MFGNTKEVIRSSNSKKDWQYNGQKKKYKRTNNDLQNITQKTKDRATRTTQITRDVLKCSGMKSSFYYTSSTHHVIVKRHEHLVG